MNPPSARKGLILHKNAFEYLQAGADRPQKKQLLAKVTSRSFYLTPTDDDGTQIGAVLFLLRSVTIVVASPSFLT